MAQKLSMMKGSCGVNLKENEHVNYFSYFWGFLYDFDQGKFSYVSKQVHDYDP